MLKLGKKLRKLPIKTSFSCCLSLDPGNKKDFFMESPLLKPAWFRDHDFIQGFKDSGPICFAFVFLGIALGGLSKTSGVSLLETISMSLFVYAMPLQILFISLMKGNLTLLTVASLTFVINARFFLMSLSLIHHFKGTNPSKIILAFFMLSASSFTVTHVKFSHTHLKNPFIYYTGVALPAYITAFIFTLVGFYIGFVSNNPILNNVFSIALAIHFTALTAMRWPNLTLVLATMLGFLAIPLLTAIVPLNVAILFGPFLAAFIVFFSKREWRAK